MYDIDEKTQICAKRKLFYSRYTLFTIKQLKNNFKILNLIGIFEIKVKMEKKIFYV